MLQKIEFMNGSYLIISDELWQWSTDENGDYNFDFVCEDQSKVSGTAITEDYKKLTALTMVIPKGTTGKWTYIEDTAISDVEWLLVSTQAVAASAVRLASTVVPPRPHPRRLVLGPLGLRWRCGSRVPLLDHFRRRCALGRLCRFTWTGWVKQGELPVRQEGRHVSTKILTVARVNKMGCMV